MAGGRNAIPSAAASESSLESGRPSSSQPVRPRHPYGQSNLPQAIKAAIPPDRLAQLQNPQVLLSDQAANAIKTGFAQFGAQGETTPPSRGALAWVVRGFRP